MLLSSIARHIYLRLLPPVGHRGPEALVAHRPPHLVETGVGVHNLEVRLRVVLHAAIVQGLGAARQLQKDQAETAKEKNIDEYDSDSKVIHTAW